MGVAVTTDLVPQRVNALDQVGTSFRHPTQNEECRPHFPVTKQIENPIGIFLDAQRIRIPGFGVDVMGKRRDVKVVFNVNGESI
jgi:hypothetical protein